MSRANIAPALLKMFPGFVSDNQRNSALIDIITAGYFLLLHTLTPKLAYCTNLDGGKPCASVLFTAFIKPRRFYSAALFPGHVLHIVLVSPKKEMVGIRASFPVARVEAMKSIRNRAMVDLVTEAVGADYSASPVSCATNTQLPISVLDGPLPFPTVIRAALVNLVPESFDCIWGELRGIMELHKKSAFLCQARDDYGRRLALSIGNYSCNYSINISNCEGERVF